MTRDWWQRLVVWSGVLLLSAATIDRFRDQGGPYFARPHTIVDHVSKEPHETRDVIVLLPQVEPQIPQGATVAVFRPHDGKATDDHGSYLAAVGLLPHHQVLPPFTAYEVTPRENLAEWVVAVKAPFNHPHYRVVAGFANGWLYRVDR